MPKQDKQTGSGDKSATKTKKATSDKAGSKAAPQRKEKENVGFICGGDVMKVNHVVMFKCDNDDVVSYVKETFVKIFGSSISGRYVKCENAEKTLQEIFDNAKDQGFTIENNCNALKVSVDNASVLLKKVTDSDVAHFIKLTENKKPKKETKDSKEKKESKVVKKTKKDTKSNKDEDEDEDEKEKEDEKEDEDDEDDDDDKSDKSDATDEEKDDVSDNDDVSDEEADKSDKDVKNKKSVPEETQKESKPCRKGGDKKPDNKSNQRTSKGKKGNESEGPK